MGRLYNGIWVMLCACALCAALCGCRAADNGNAPDTSPPPPVPDSLTGQAAHILEEQTLVTVDGRGVPAWQCLYWLSLACDRANGETSGVPDWQKVSEQALMNTALYASVENLAEAYGVTFDESDVRAVSERWRKRCEAHGGETEYLREIARYGLNRQRAETLFKISLLYGKLRALCEDGGALAPEQSTLDALAKESGIQVDRILCADADRNTARRRAEACFVQLNGAANQAELFRELTWEGSDHTGPRTLKEGTFDERLTQVARALRIGQISGIIESSDGFSILRRLPPERESLLDLWLRRVVEGAAQNADVELAEQYVSLDPAEFSAALNALRESQ